MRVLVVNAGSSSLKLSVLDGEELVDGETVPMQEDEPDRTGVERFLESAGSIVATGHRIVHGGMDFAGPVLVDTAVRRRIDDLSDLAPLHQRGSLVALDVVNGCLPGVQAVACFDTAFHRTIPAAAATYALPAEWRRRWPLRRFGFHGLSHAYASKRAADLVGRPVGRLRTVSCHLGAGASVTAVLNGASVDTTMGFTPLEGLVMATRSGSVDPGMLTWLQGRAGLGPSELSDALEHRSGLLGLAGSADMRALLRSETDGDSDAHLAVEVYLRSVVAGVASMAASMEGIDVLSFTGGIGENSPAIRARTARRLAHLGVSIDPVRNEQGTGDRDLSASGALVHTVVIEAREDLEIAGQVRGLIRGTSG